ncbi:MAG TPA: ABC transporter ATP-binding protein [Planctomycetes bacterium]|nr:ABC transporter ATP-binding protein [Planctomycetota bacterium]
MKGTGEIAHTLHVAREFREDLVPHRSRLALVGGLSLLVTLLDLLKPWPLRWIVDGALAPGGAASAHPTRTIVLGALAAVAIVSLRAGLGYVREIELAQVGHRFTRALRHRIFAHLSKLSPRFHARHKSGDLLVRLTGDVPMVSTMMVDSAIELATRGVLVLGTVAVMFAVDPLLTTAILATLPVVLLVVRWISGKIRIAVRKQRRKAGDLADYLHEAIAASETIQSLGSSDHVVRRFARNNRRTERAGLKAKRLTVRMGATVESLLGVAMAGVLLLGSLRVQSGDLQLGELLVFLSYVRSVLKPLRSFSKHADRIAKGTACGERIQTILHEQPEIASEPGAPPAPAHPRALEFRHVSFAYERGSRALVRFDATFRRGELAALVGRSGAGKSTAVALAARLFDPDEGRVLLDGEPLPSFDLDSLRSRVGLCLQRTVLFGESIRENLLLARPDASEAELHASLAEAGASEFIAELTDGIDTELGSLGAGLSGGQVARIALARTLLRGAPILLVDEPFAGLDREAAGHVADTLRRLARERIVVVIAHDLERLDEYDRIVFLDAGRKVAEGRHEHLLDVEPLYRRVVRTTAGASL